MSHSSQLPDFGRMAGVFVWLVEPKSMGLRSNRAVALTLALIGPRAWNVQTLAEVARIERLSERTLRSLRRELRLSFGIVPPCHVSAAPFQGVNAIQEATEPDFAEMGVDDESSFFAAGPHE